ncbi:MULTISPECIES: PIG-L deacetylase family protein [Protofrankia]|uniref:LmbE-like protein n=1 Tax=Candidatus Protofrankia californiensis TaxID=1839754 RepID=A0A1C3NV11_9ACTN|nr:MULTISPECIES: PIG-L family deacetylase [Protofrankia]SBW19266.1 LmbE-like protein [Candidatus Protofrankia californiensis]
MLEMTAGRPADGHGYRILALGAHADDVEIGAGGTIVQLLAQHPTASVHWVVFASSGERGNEAESSARDLLGTSLGSLHLHEVRDGFLPREWGGVKEVLLQIARQVSPDVVFAPSLSDAHQDHRTLAELAWQAFRGTLILSYEIPKWDGDMMQPSLYVPLSEETVTAKLAHITQHFPSQKDKPWFDEETFRAMLRLRGVECGTRYAEAFDARKVVFRW